MNDTDKYPLYEYRDGKIIPLNHKAVRYNWHYHHFVEKKFLKKYPQFEKYQKLIFMPADMNYDIERRTRPERFKERWGVEIQDVVFLKEYFYKGYYETI